MSNLSSQQIGPPILIIGLGNPILGDDGIGWKVADQVRTVLENRTADQHLPHCEVDCLSVGGLSLMERMVGYDEVILIDAMQTGDLPIGSVKSLALEDIPNRAWGHLTSSHDTTLHNALAVGKQMSAHLPQFIWVVGIEADQVFDFSESLTPLVAEAIPKAVKMVIKRVRNFETPSAQTT
jgi:hydrogenase maturation protease